MDKQKIIELLAKELELSPVELEKCRAELPLTEIGLTSLRFISFIVKLEEAFGIEILDSDLMFENFLTTEKMFATLQKYFTEERPIKKCLILDADGVLWKGISGEEDIVIDKQVLELQTALLDLYNRGVLLCICSKNEDFLIERSFAEPNMLLRKENFVSILSNRRDKVTNICSIADELNLCLDSMVFVDDNDYEIGFVSLNLPEVECIKFDYYDTYVIPKISEFFLEIQSTSDVNRTQLYLEQKSREKEKLKFTSVKEYNASLMTKVTVARAKAEDRARLAELSLRTHQFNLSDISYTEEQLGEMLADSEYKIFSVSVNDKYGKMGIVGMAVLKENVIEAFMISCRAFDRDFELILLDALKEASAIPLRGIYVQSDKNQRYASFYADNGVEII